MLWCCDGEASRWGKVVFGEVMHKSLASKLSLKHSFLPLANLLLVPILTSSAMAASSEAPIALPSPATLPEPATLPKPAATKPQTSTSRKLVAPVLPQGTLHREGAATIVSATTERAEIQKASTRIALQTSLPAAQPRVTKAGVPSAKVVKVSTSSPTPANAVLFSPASTPKVVTPSVEKTKIVTSKVEVTTKTEVETKTEDAPKTRAVTRIATLPKEDVKPVEKNATARRAQPTVLSSRHRTPVAVDDDMALLAQLERELQASKTDLRRANANLSAGQRELQKFNGVLRQAMLEAGADAKGLHPFVKVAQRYAGTPYVWGGESARGFDCSGFIIRVMRDLGYKALPHSAAEQFKYGMPVAQPLLKPGDLVFFANTYKPGISHVGIYLGKRRFIHAAGTGLGTIVSTLDNPKYQAKYAGARRLVSVR